MSTLPPGRPSVRRTRSALLVGTAAAGLVVGLAVRPVWEQLGSVAPTVPWSTAIVLGFTAAVVGALAWSTYDALHRQRQRMNARRGLRLLVLGKTGAVAGALVAGAYAGYALAWLDRVDLPLPRDRVVHSAAAAVGGVLLVVAGLLLERACEVPRHDDDDDPHPA